MIRKILFLILLSLFLSSPAEAYDWTQDANCQGAWLMDIDEDPLTDSSGNGRTGALLADGEPDFATASPPAGYSTGYYVFDGNNDKVEVSDNSAFDFSGAFTIVSWIDTDVTDAQIRILNKYDSTSKDGYWLGQIDRDSGLWKFSVLVNPANAEAVSNSAPSGGWKHLAGVREDDDDVVLYVDGVLQNDTGSLAGAMNNTGSLWISADFQGQGNFVNGELDEVAVFDKELTLTDINDIMDNGLVQVAAATGTTLINVTVQ